MGMPEAAAAPCFCWSDGAEYPTIHACAIAFTAANAIAVVVVISGSGVVMVAGSWPTRRRFLVIITDPSAQAFYLPRLRFCADNPV
jgi:hypothetical protein